MYMVFYWLHNIVKQQQFHVYWQHGATNKAYYLTKHHPMKHHTQVRPTYISKGLKYIHVGDTSLCNTVPFFQNKTQRTLSSQRSLL